MGQMYLLPNLLPPKLNMAPEKLPVQKERLVFQPSFFFFRGELLNFGGVPPQLAMFLLINKRATLSGTNNNG